MVASAAPDGNAASRGCAGTPALARRLHNRRAAAVLQRHARFACRQNQFVAVRCFVVSTPRS